ncbi:hypothetical protein EVAR_76402_1 [Eumeta japonica]|uniref:Uncharacterized protein n=1 Tax=Eumeta variegata TaxID=151549 RepID=A0A4C1T8U6_EUMVA|nr:hypothetical protein EVAR_76402_1 [Eumeta japonica]
MEHPYRVCTSSVGASNEAAIDSRVHSINVNLVKVHSGRAARGRTRRLAGLCPNVTRLSRSSQNGITVARKWGGGLSSPPPVRSRARTRCTSCGHVLPTSGLAINSSASRNIIESAFNLIRILVLGVSVIIRLKNIKRPSPKQQLSDILDYARRPPRRHAAVYGILS